MILGVLIAYLCGSIPTAVWWGRTFYNIDVREHGSRNAGATNTFRVLGRRAGFPVLFIDILKSFLPTMFLPIIFDVASGSDARVMFRIIIALAAVIGHLYPVFARFRGGKGIASSLGGILAIHPPAAAICVGVFLIVFFTTRFVSLASLMAAVAFPLLIAFVYRHQGDVLLFFSIALCALVFFTHRQNIGRLLKGEEKKMAIGRSEANIT